MHTRCLMKCFYDIFSLVWIPMSTKLWGFTCLLICNVFGSLVVFLTHYVPLVVDHALFMYCTLVLDAHTLSPLSCHVLIHAFVSVWSSSIYNMSFYLCLCSLNLVFRVFSFFFLGTNLNLIKFVAMLCMVFVCMFVLQMSWRSSHRKKPMVGIPFSLASKRTRQASATFDHKIFKTLSNFQSYNSHFKNAPTLVERVVKFETLGSTSFL